MTVIDEAIANLKPGLSKVVLFNRDTGLYCSIGALAAAILGQEQFHHDQDEWHTNYNFKNTAAFEALYPAGADSVEGNAVVAAIKQLYADSDRLYNFNGSNASIIYTFNDDKLTTHEQVLEVFALAKQKLEGSTS